MHYEELGLRTVTGAPTYRSMQVDEIYLETAAIITAARDSLTLPDKVTAELARIKREAVQEVEGSVTLSRLGEIAARNLGRLAALEDFGYIIPGDEAVAEGGLTAKTAEETAQ